MSIIRFEDLSQIRERHRKQKVVFCSGTLDLTHAGHFLFFDDCKKFGDILIVGVGPDHDIRINKGLGRPILNEKVRLFTVSRLAMVDYCFITPNMQNEKEPLEPLEKVFKALKPDIYVINEDAFDIPSRKDRAAFHGIRLETLRRWCPPEFESISTTGLIQKIKQLPLPIRQGERI